MHNLLKIKYYLCLAYNVYKHKLYKKLEINGWFKIKLMQKDKINFNYYQLPFKQSKLSKESPTLTC
ncbi:hypothetical protein NEPAR06_1621 [Nematocida parisii]|uniref:Uncharacterized protein n=1 Tax=Nematocida parisii (strain ERTm3) TaxID=935791 RepID=I3EGK0_NEMP3|nr:hypothetical protein NEQG_01791 [Nematocida parisii ERTm3]KAI5127659.1 hypothetical protein NEPAR08_0966 [Nematocida parisii]KAI5129506.1 hypothetical protein NEPAR03_1669 [Nematocida parisii]KAI5141216.1 hypothetical protein NEPAR04_0786 [Nematocida parisii]KAI5144751.1 hypothetical protein NEPAR07_1246 [Nematocida parisii]